MKQVHKLSAKWHITKRNVILVAVLWMASSHLHGQSLVSSSDFFNPDYEARRPGNGLSELLLVDTTDFTPGAETQGNVTWNHTAAGLVSLGLDLGLVGNVNANLAAYTRTSGDVLTFGRELDLATSGALGGLGAAITTVTDGVLGASAVNGWESTATVTGLNLTQGQTYRVTFDVTTGAGLNLNGLDFADFTLLNQGTVISNTSADQTLNVLDLVVLGNGSGLIDFEFVALDNYSELSFNFQADTIANVQLLGPVSGNQTVLQFSNMSLTPVPEAGSLFLLAVGMIFQLRRHRRHA